MNKPLLNDGDLRILARGIKGLAGDEQLSVFERLVAVRNLYQSKVDALSRYQPIEGAEPVMVCWSYHVPEMGDDSTKFAQAQIYSGGIAFDMDDLDISGTGYEIVKVQP